MIVIKIIYKVMYAPKKYLFKVNNRGTKTTSVTYFTSFCSVSIIGFERVNIRRLKVYYVLKLFKSVRVLLI